jgi:hypothetical protein
MTYFTAPRPLNSSVHEHAGVVLISQFLTFIFATRICYKLEKE